mmetsp:Transcript_6659/g.14572  ORF Transcript_6659/g.14572 Transcript_6659/m.14572 type:complete len:234 (-) Transcript_6659:2316-3017(-)
MFNNIIGFGTQIFTAIVLLLSAGISAHMCYGFGTRKGREAFIGLILLLMVGTQVYHLIDASLYVPATRFYVYNSELHRTDCLESGKGGKRPSKEVKEIDQNPCYCLSSVANCTDVVTGLDISNVTCPFDGSATCSTRSTGVEIKPYHSRKRDCQGGQRPSCTMDEPCTPCERSRLLEFGASRCRTCSTDFLGNCNFIPGVGPYCFESHGYKHVVACTQCCTEAETLIVNGTCY